MDYVFMELPSMLKHRLRFPWEHLAGLLFTAVFVVWLVGASSDMLTVFIHIPVPPILVSVVFGGLLFLLYQGVVVAAFHAGAIAFLYSALVWGPFIYLWVICSMYHYPTWLALFPAFIAPLGFLGVACARWRSSTPPLDLMRVVETSGSRYITGLQILASAFFAYGSYIYAFIQRESVIAVLVVHWLSLLIIGGVLMGGLLVWYIRRRDHSLDLQVT